MTRLPTPGGDDNTWGNILNDFLSVEHATDGSLKLRSDGTLSGKEDKTNKGAADGYASLDGNGRLPLAQLPAQLNFTLLSLLNGARDYNTLFPSDGFDDPGYATFGPFIVLTGIIDVQQSTTMTLAQLPSGFRPRVTRRFLVDTNNGPNRLNVNADGTIVVAGTPPTQWVALDCMVPV